MFRLFYPLLKLPETVSVPHGHIPVTDKRIIQNTYLAFVGGSWHRPPKNYFNSRAATVSSVC